MAAPGLDMGDAVVNDKVVEISAITLLGNLVR
jgi:hypothetical protein